MIAHIFELEQRDGYSEYVSAYIRTHNLEKASIVTIHPEEDKFELTVEQLRGLRKLIRYEYTNPIVVTLTAVDRSSLEVQNMLLKELEEHQASIHYLLFVESVNSLVEPILSRCKIAYKSRKVNNLPQAVQMISEDGHKPTLGEVDMFITSLIPRIKRLHLLNFLLKQRQLLLNNNVSPQSVYDAILIFMRKEGSMKV